MSFGNTFGFTPQSDKPKDKHAPVQPAPAEKPVRKRKRKVKE